MGVCFAMHVLMDHPDLLRKVVIAGVGEAYFEHGPDPRKAFADALLLPDKSKISDPVQRRFREFADQAGKDRRALAACMRGNRRLFTGSDLQQSKRPVLVVCGENDDIAGLPGPLAQAFADGRAIVVPRRDHMTAVGDKVYKQAVLDFFRA